MEDLVFKLNRIEFKGKEYLALTFEGQIPVQFIFIEKSFKKYWLCLTTMKEVKQKEFVKLLNQAFNKVAEAVK